MTISGPAAGLAPALFAGMLALGHGNLEQGYPLVLVAILLVGILQVLLAKFKVARLSAENRGLTPPARQKVSASNGNGKAPLEIEGLDRMRRLSGHESSMRLGIQTLNSE